jgi:gluconokinase
MTVYPRSPYDAEGGLRYFPRMLHKIRLQASRELGADYQENLGGGMDGRLCRFLRIDYAALRERTLDGGSDADILAWCQEKGRLLNEEDVAVWNGFCSKRGWNDEATPILEKHKAASGLAHREDLRTFFEYFEVDEKRRP